MVLTKPELIASLKNEARILLQLFLYLKACGRVELSTMNLWGGVDAPVAV